MNNNTTMRLMIGAVAALLALPALATDVDVSTVITNTVDNGTNSYNFGVTASGISLVISNGGQLVNVTTGSIGVNNGANSNAVTIIGSGSAWTNSGTFMVGDSGAGNALTISAGGNLTNSTGTIGNNSGANNNSVIVTGSGSMWSHLATSGNTLVIGNNGASNTLTISNGGIVTNGPNGIIGNGAGASNNSVIVTGSGSLWYQGGSGGIKPGTSGASCALIVSNGGAVKTTGICSVGENGGSTGNNILITGSGSAWTLLGNSALKFGHRSASNTLTLANGGQLIHAGTGNAAYIGRATNGSGDPSSNTVTVTDSGSVWNLGNGGISLGDPSINSTNNALIIFNGGLVTNLTVITVRGTNSVINLGNGTGLGSMSVSNVNLLYPSASLNFNSGLLRASAAGGLITGVGVVSNVGPAYISTDFASSIPSNTITGPGSLTKLGTGTLTLGGTNTYGGDTIVSNGVLQLSQPNALGTGTVVRLTTGQGTLDLAFSGTNKVAELYTNHVKLAVGVYGSNSVTLLTGGGYLQAGLPLAASFVAFPTNGVGPLLVNFTDTSSGGGNITNRYWDLGDGTLTNLTATNLTHTYTSASNFTVLLVVSDDVGVSSTNSAMVAVTVLPGPTGLTAVAWSDRVDLSWDVLSGSDSYFVKRATTNGGPYTAIFAAVTNKYTDSTVTNGTTYYYVVAGTNSVGEGVNSAEVSATPYAPASAFPAGSGFSLNPATGIPTLRFNATSNFQYRVQYTADLTPTITWLVLTNGAFPPPDGWRTAISNATMSLTDPGAASSSQRFYRVEAANPPVP